MLGRLVAFAAIAFMAFIEVRGRISFFFFVKVKVATLT
jgi:hypothetical protein